MMMVLVPTSNGIDETVQCEVPVAVPVLPVDDCHVTFVIPAPPDAVPAMLNVEAFTLTIAAEGVERETVTGVVLVVPDEGAVVAASVTPAV
jgi:hypothetical protein